MKKILIVDDDEELRANLSEILAQAGYAADEAATGAEAVEMAGSRDYDVVLLDKMMPGMDGVETLMELRKAAPRSKVIMVTAFATVEAAVDAVKRGVSQVVSKPFKIEQLLVLIRQAIEEAAFEKGVERLDLDKTLSAMANPIRRTIIKLLHRGGPLRLMEMSRRLDIGDHTKTIFHIRILKELDLVCQSETDRHYFLTAKGERLINCLEILEKHIESAGP
ncbi:MAG TPA: response regulator [Deltaproteobacteria bacterium]|nr:response regulator [Deltaproteobacteria bacterium]